MMYRVLAMIVVLSGCTTKNPDADTLPPDMISVDMGHDLKTAAPDLLDHPDMATAPDMLADVDMTPEQPSPDLSEAPADMAQAPDLMPACGGLNQACCANNKCNAGFDCLRQTSTGNIKCVPQNGGCGAYLGLCCDGNGGIGVNSGGNWCAKDPNSASDGNALGWYQCFSNGCHP